MNWTEALLLDRRLGFGHANPNIHAIPQNCQIPPSVFDYHLALTQATHNMNLLNSRLSLNGLFHMRLGPLQNIVRQ